MWLACQDDGGQHPTSLRLDMASKVRQRTAHADEIVDLDVIGASRHCAIETRLSRQAGEPVGAGMCHDVGLNHTVVDLPAEFLGDYIRQHLGNRIHPLAFVGMGADQYGMVVAD